MYTHILASVLDDLPEKLTGTALFEYALDCRAEMLASSLGRGDDAFTVLAADLTYDRVLYKLCESSGFTNNIWIFAQPIQARRCLESQLATIGLDLATPARHRPPHA